MRRASAKNSVMVHTGDILEFESVALPGVGVLRTIDLAGEHLERAHPQRAVIIQFAIDDHRQAGFRIRGEILNEVPVALEMAVDAAAEDGVRLRGFGSGTGVLAVGIVVHEPHRTRADGNPTTMIMA